MWRSQKLDFFPCAESLVKSHFNNRCGKVQIHLQQLKSVSQIVELLLFLSQSGFQPMRTQTIFLQEELGSTMAGEATVKRLTSGSPRSELPPSSSSPRSLLPAG